MVRANEKNVKGKVALENVEWNNVTREAKKEMDSKW